jgi:hypothetical protein
MPIRDTVKQVSSVSASLSEQALPGGNTRLRLKRIDGHWTDSSFQVTLFLIEMRPVVI